MEFDNNKYRKLFAKMPDAFAYHQVIYDQEGNPFDYQFLEINDAFEQLTGLKREAVIGKKVTEVHLDIKVSAFNWIGVYGRVALGEEAVRFAHYFEPAERWHDVSAYSDAPGYFSAVFRDITEKRQAEEDLLALKTF